MAARHATGDVVGAVGRTRDEAASIFGPAFDDLFLTTFDAYADEAPADGFQTLCVTAGEGAADFISAAGPGTASRILIQLPVEKRETLLDALADATDSRYGGIYVGEQPCLVVARDAELDTPQAAADQLAQTPPPPPPVPAEPLATPRRLYDRPQATKPAKPVEVEPPAPSGPSLSTRIRSAARRALLLVPRALGVRSRRGKLVIVSAFVLGVVVVTLVAPLAVGIAGGSAFSWMLAFLLSALAVVQFATLAALFLVVARLASVAGLGEWFAEQDRRGARRQKRLVGLLNEQGKRGTRQGERLERLSGKVERLASIPTDVAAKVTRDIAPTIHASNVSTRRLIEQGTRQTEAALSLFTSLGVSAPVPPLGGWAASPDVVLNLVQTVADRKPRLVVECGSGVSTLFLSLAAAKFSPETRVVALEHEPDYAAGTRRLLEQHGVSHIGEVRDAPLVDSGLKDHEPPWYDQAAIADLQDIGLLFVDGPPASYGHHVRFPAVPMLQDRLAPGVVIVLDDMIRQDEKEVIEEWSALLPDFQLKMLPMQKGAARLSRG